MPANLTHSPADVVRKHLVDQAVGTLPSAGGSWPIAVGDEAESPDNFITLYDTTSESEGADQRTGYVSERYGLQVRVRCANYADGHIKISTIEYTLDRLNRAVVVVGSSSYMIHAVTRRSGAFHLGKDTPNSKRDLFTLNILVKITQTS
jgi:hypothetical protein